MTCVEKILSILEWKKIPVSRMERDLGFGNGYIKQLRKGTLPDNRLQKVSNYLEVPVENLLSDDEIPMDEAIESYLAKCDADLIFALFGEPDDTITTEDLERIRDYAKYIRDKRRGETE